MTSQSHPLGRPRARSKLGTTTHSLQRKRYRARRQSSKPEGHQAQAVVTTLRILPSSPGCRTNYKAAIHRALVHLRQGGGGGGGNDGAGGGGGFGPGNDPPPGSNAGSRGKKAIDFGGPEGPDDPDSDPDDDHQSESNSEDRRRAARIKEADEIKLGTLPQVSQFRAWKSGVATIVNTASGRGDDLALQWFLMCEDLKCDITQFRRSGSRSRTLDKKLATAICKIVDGELGRKVHQFLGSTQTDETRSPKGRELWCILLVYYSTDCRAQAMYSLEDLEQVKC